MPGSGALLEIFVEIEDNLTRIKRDLDKEREKSLIQLGLPTMTLLRLRDGIGKVICGSWTLLFLKRGSGDDGDDRTDDDATDHESFELSSQLNTVASITPPGLPGIASNLRL